MEKTTAATKSGKAPGFVNAINLNIAVEYLYSFRPEDRAGNPAALKDGETRNRYRWHYPVDSASIQAIDHGERHR